MDTNMPVNLTGIVTGTNVLRLYVGGAFVTLCIAMWMVIAQLRSNRFKNPWWTFFSCGRAFYQIQLACNLLSPLLYAVVNVRYAMERWWYQTPLLPFDETHGILNCVARAIYLASASIPLFYFMEVVEITRIPPFLMSEPLFPGFFYFFFGIELILSFLFCHISVRHDLVFLIVTVVLSTVNTIAATLLTIWERERTIEELCRQPVGFKVHSQRKYNIKVISMCLSQAMVSTMINLLAVYFYLENYQQWEIPHSVPFAAWTFGKIIDWLDLDRWYSPTAAQRIAYAYRERARNATGPLTSIGRPALRSPRNMEENPENLEVPVVEMNVAETGHSAEWFTLEESEDPAGHGSNEPPAEETSCPL